MSERGGQPDDSAGRDGIEHTRYLPPVESFGSGSGEPGWGERSQYGSPPVWQSYDAPPYEPPQYPPQQHYWQPQPETPPPYQQPYPGAYGQPAYGQYGYPGAVAPAPPARRKTGHALLWTLVALLVVVAALVAAAFVVKPSFLPFNRVFDNNAVAATIVSQSNGRYSAVSCPANEPAKAGTSFQCTASNGAKINVQVTSNRGDYVWSPAR